MQGSTLSLADAGRLSAGWSSWMAPLVSVLLGIAALTMLAACRRQMRRQSAEPRLRQAVDRLRLAHKDGLTGLANRQGFLAALAVRLSCNQATALLLLDLDRFAAINAERGHRAADELLVAVADRLRTLVPDARHLGRLGGDEFGVLISMGGGSDAAEAAALRLVRAVAAPLRTGIQTVECSASLGVAVSPEHGADADALLAAAQAALGTARGVGGGAWRLFQPERARDAQARAALSTELGAALASNAIVPHYQLLVELATGGVAGLEVLARWNHPVRGLLAAEDFVQIAETQGLAGQLTERLMRRVMADMRDWPPGLRYSFNVLPGQLREIIAMVRNPPIWPEGVFDPGRIAIDVTERALLEDVGVMREVIDVLHARGTQVVLDDFGAGTASLAHLRALNFDAIKIDGVFVAGVTEDERASACVRAMLGLGRSLGIDMVAEGVESAEVSDCLAGMGCRFGQGFFYGGPVPARDVAGLLRRHATRSPGRRDTAPRLVCGGAPSN